MSSEISIPVWCPRCQHDVAFIAIGGITIVSVTCAKCLHNWAMDIHNMSVPARTAVREALLQRNASSYLEH